MSQLYGHSEMTININFVDNIILTSSKLFTKHGKSYCGIGLPYEDQ